MNNIFLIQECWLDQMENRNAHGYKPYSYVSTEDQAKEFCDAGGFFTNDDCWAVVGQIPKFSYVEIPLQKPAAVECIYIALTKDEWSFINLYVYVADNIKISEWVKNNIYMKFLSDRSIKDSYVITIHFPVQYVNSMYNAIELIANSHPFMSYSRNETANDILTKFPKLN